MRRLAANPSGFTLIETIVYIGLFSTLLVFSIVTAYQIMEGAQRFKKATVREAEANFILRKLDWALTNVASVTAPTLGTAGTCPNTPLSVTKTDASTMEFALVGSSLQLNGQALNADHVAVSCFQATYSDADGAGSGKAGSIQVQVTIEGVSYTTTKHLRTL